MTSRLSSKLGGNNAGAFLLNRTVEKCGYDVLPDGITVAMGNTAYSTLIYGTFFVIMIVDVLCITGLPKAKLLKDDEMVN